MTNLSKLTNQELMELAKKPLKDNNKELKKLPVIRQFIISEKIVEDDTLIPAMVIYDRYERWAFGNGYKILTVTKFFMEFKKYFQKVISNSGSYYKLSPKGFDLSEQHLQEVNAKFLKEKRISNGKKEDKKKKIEKKDI